MFGKLKQLFCAHDYVVYIKPEPIFLSVGDESQGRESYEYYMSCNKCGNEVTLYKDWHTIHVERNIN